MNEQSILSYVKKVIRALIISSPDRMTVEQLKRDYASEEGSPVPFYKLGFKDIECFLNSISDTVTLVGCGPMAQVCAKRHEKTAHIESLVQCQKKQRNRPRNRGQPNSKFWYPSEISDIVFVNEQTKRCNSNNNNNGSWRQAQLSADQRSSNWNNNRHSRQCSNRAPAEKSVGGISSIRNSVSKLSIANVDDESSSDESNINENCIPKGKIIVKSDEAQKQPDIRANTMEKSEFIVPPSDEACDDANCQKYSSNLRKAEVVPKLKTKWEEPVVHYVSSDEGNESDAIPAYAVDDRVFGMEYPKDVVRFNQQLPQRNIHNKFKLEDRIEVQLVTVASPHIFHFWTHDAEYEDYKNMADYMQQFYNNIDEIKYNMPSFLIMPDHLGAIRFRDSVWHRVQVLSIKAGSKNNIEAKLVDTGERLWICPTQIKFLSKEFAKLPPQCWPGRLACVAPRHGQHFSVEASNYFYDLVCYRRLYARIEKINDANATLHMILVDPDAAFLTKNINLALIESGSVRRSYTI
ncbi:GH20095 [Drosophila grimshawi]|uniref:GH20095 n=1 Tax=Drosophila grimshawi TaxID=7222 RepID=B4J761_DROGR|nr:GH20095 [Drosophila grimshawi]